MFLGNIKQAFEKNPNLSNLLLDEFFKTAIQNCQVGAILGGGGFHAGVALNIHSSQILGGGGGVSCWGGVKHSFIPNTALQRMVVFGVFWPFCFLMSYV